VHVFRDNRTAFREVAGRRRLNASRYIASHILVREVFMPCVVARVVVVVMRVTLIPSEKTLDRIQFHGALRCNRLQRGGGHAPQC
jgi:hypothetical protein